ncbi:MAG: primosomal replication protein N [Burkholderia sp.]|nr:primosomal replication protein N [Burkholderia sp.]
MNKLQLVASVVERSPVRYTPAGIPLASATLHHCAELIEDSVLRHIEMMIDAIAVGETSVKLENCKIGIDTMFTGFLARKSRNTRALVFHITTLHNIGEY